MARRNRQPTQRQRQNAGPFVGGKAKSQSGGDPVERHGGRLRRLTGFVGEVRGELAKTDFPNRQQTAQSTMVVLAACLLVGFYLYGLDQVFSRFVEHLLNWQS
jgi:preprotein translocase subunit SecE